MFPHKISFRVRYAETDQMGVVHHGNYAQYFEMGRIEWLRHFGISYKKMEADGIILPVVSFGIKFKRSAEYDDELVLTTKLKAMPTAKIEFEYELNDVSGNLISTGQTTLAFINADSNRPMRCPDFLLKTLRDQDS